MHRLFVVALIACTPSKPTTTVPAPPGTTAVEEPAPSPAPPPVVEPPAEARAEVMAQDTPRTTAAGTRFIAPAEWSVLVRGTATILSPPEGDSQIAIVDLAEAKSADNAIELAWAAYGKKPTWPVIVQRTMPDRDGWSQGRSTLYQTSPNEKRTIVAEAYFANGMWTGIVYDVASATGDKRRSQINKLLGELVPKGYAKESFAGKQAHPLDKARIAELSKFIETAQKDLNVPGVALGIVQGGKVVFAGGFGVRELGKPAKIDADTKFIIASNTKSLTTLMLAKLVDEKKLTWETTAQSLLPQFKLGDADTTARVAVKHLICACTGLPRQDLEMIFESGRYNTADKTLGVLATMQPTSKFGELFQYSNPLASAAGYIGGHVAFPKLELGKAYDEVMRTRVFAPLGMTATTFDFKRAQTGNFARAHAPDVDGKPLRVNVKRNELIIPMRPAGGAWSSVRDLLKYVQMELAEGKLPNGKQYVSKETLLARRAPQVATSNESSYAMGLSINNAYGVTVVHHGGDIIGFHSDMMWLPEHGVGAVILTNGTPGGVIRGQFQRKLLEVLFDGKPLADAEVATTAKNIREGTAATRKTIQVPADPEAVKQLAPKYTNAALGEIEVTTAGGKVIFDFGELTSEVATRKNPDGTLAFISIEPGFIGLPFVTGTAGGKRTLTLRSAQQEYVFTES